MPHTVRGLGLATFLTLVSCLAVVPLAMAQSTTAVANVYVQVQGPAGPVYGYNASSRGSLTAISGSPFKPGTAIIGGTSSRFFTLGKTKIHSYGVSSNGAIQSQLSQASIFDFAGSSCGDPQQGANGAVLDHSAKYLYVLLQGFTCGAYQSYIINKDGSFTFDGETEKNLENVEDASNEVGLPSILGNETFAYSDFTYLDSGPSLIGFRRESSGTLELMQFNETDPTLNGYPAAAKPDASPTGNYVVVQLFADDTPPPQLASYTVDAQGNLSTTNTASNMPTSAFSSPFSAFSPSGNLLAVYANGTAGNGKSGIEVYKFNGAAPLTLYKTLLSGTPVDDVAWDSSNHLYAISRASNKLYVFTVTSTSVTQDAAYSIGAPFSIVAVSRGSSGAGTCAAPSGDGVNVCSPEENISATSPVQFNAAANVSGGVYRFELWAGSAKLASVDSGIMNQSVALTPGTYHLTFSARNIAGEHEYATRDITVK